MITSHDHRLQLVVETVCVLAGALAGLLVAFASTRHLALATDPVGLIGTWITAAALCGFIGWMIGFEVEETHHHHV